MPVLEYKEYSKLQGLQHQSKMTRLVSPYLAKICPHCLYTWSSDVLPCGKDQGLGLGISTLEPLLSSGRMPMPKEEDPN